MNPDLIQHLESVDQWIRRQGDSSPVHRAEILTAEERKQLQAVNKTIRQLESLGVSVPPDLRELKLRLSAKEDRPAGDPEREARIKALEHLIGRLRELSKLARIARDALSASAHGSGNKQHYGVQLADLIEAGLLSVSDRLELQWKKDGPVFEGRIKADGRVEAKTDAGWRVYETLSAAAADIGGRALNGWDHWSRIDSTGLMTPLREIRAKLLKERTD